MTSQDRRDVDAVYALNRLRTYARKRRASPRMRDMVTVMIYLTEELETARMAFESIVGASDHKIGGMIKSEDLEKLFMNKRKDRGGDDKSYL